MASEDSPAAAPEVAQDAPPLTGEGKTVCVTGVTGFVGSHVMVAFLQRGYTVRGTVRDASNEEKTAWVKKLAEGTPGQLELFSADLEKPGSFDEAVAGSDYVVHVAAVVKFNAKDPQKDIVDPALEGTKNVLQSVLKAKQAKRVVYTSSTAAISHGKVEKGHVFTEEDWNIELDAKRDPYPTGKTLAEKEAWRIYEEQPKGGDGGEGGDDSWRFELVSVNPSMVIGKMLHKTHARSSMQVVEQILDGTLYLAPDFAWGVVHVDDVALAHVLAVEDESASGRYLICNEDTLDILQLGGILAKHFPQNKKIPKAKMPHFLTYVLGVVHPSLTLDYVRMYTGRRDHFNTAKSKKLGINYKTTEQALLDAANSMIDFGIIKA